MMMRKKWVVAALALSVTVASSIVGLKAAQATEGAGAPPPPAGPVRRMYWRALGIKTAPLIIRTVDANTMKPIPGAGCVVGETGDRVETNAQGVSRVIDAPVFRNPRLEQMLAELHGQLTVICYKNGYRDAIHVGVRMHEGVETRQEVWMYHFGPEDRRIEPTLYNEPFHRIWRVQLADKYRLREEGQGNERPQLTRPGAGIAPQEAQGYGIQSPLRTPEPPTGAPR